MGPSASPFDGQGWCTFLRKHSTPGALAEALEGNGRDKGSLSDVEWWEKDSDDEKDKGKNGNKSKDGYKGKDGDKGKKGDDDDNNNDDEYDEEPLSPGWWAKNVLGEDLTARLEALIKDAKAIGGSLGVGE
jgi:hypothetical protein